MSEAILCPLHYQIIEHFVENKRGAWAFFEGDVFYNPRNIAVQTKEKYKQFDLTKKEIILQLFRVGAGKLGYYLVNLRERKYYYCGKDWEDVRAKFVSLGIGREDPIA